MVWAAAAVVFIGVSNNLIPRQYSFFHTQKKKQNSWFFSIFSNLGKKIN